MYFQTRNFKVVWLIFLTSLLPLVAHAQRKPGFKKISLDLQIVENSGATVDVSEVSRIFFKNLEGYTYKGESDKEWQIRFDVYQEKGDPKNPFQSNRIDHIGQFSFLKDEIIFKLDSLHNDDLIVYAIVKRSNNLEEDITALAEEAKGDINDFYFGTIPGRRSTVYVSSGDDQIHHVAGFRINRNKVSELSLLRSKIHRHLTAITDGGEEVELKVTLGIKEGIRYRYWRIRKANHIVESQKWRGGASFFAAPKGEAISFSTEVFLERFFCPVFFLRGGGQYYNFGVEQSLQPLPGDPADSYVQRKRSLKMFIGSGVDLFFDDGLVSLSFTVDGLVFNKGLRGLCHLRLNKFPRFALSGGWQSLETIERRVFQPNGGQPKESNGKIRVASFIGGVSCFNTF